MEKEKETGKKTNFIKEKWKKFKEYINKKYEKHLKYFKERKKKVDIYFVIILSMLSSLSIYMLYERKILNQENIYVLMAILTISFIVYIFSIRKNFKSKNINELDKAIFFSNIFLITSLFMIIIIKSIKNRDLFLFPRLFHLNISLSFTVIITSVIIVLTVFSLILIIRRFFLFKKFNNENNMKENKKNTYTLWDIYTGNFNNKDLKNLKIEDSDKIEYDLFGRTSIVDNLYDSITNFKEHSDCFTIGVVGEWGSGKSSIIELTKNKILSEKSKDEFIIIDDFDPWAIKSQDALILAIYNTIVENLGENIGYFKRKKVQNALINITTNIPYIGKGIGNYFENRIDDYSEYKEIKADLEEKLKKSDKRLVFIIDNLDRMNSNNVLFLLTLIGTLFKLPNITYIVSYDKKRLKAIFKIDKINSNYIEKIINQEIIVPRIHNLDKQYVFYYSLKNCFYNDNNDYKISDTDEKILKIIASKFDNIRDFIRFLNFVIYDVNSNYLWKIDFLIIRTIEFLDYELYKKIYINKNFITIILEHEYNFTKEQKEFFEEVKKSTFFDLLQYLSSGISNFSIFKKKKRNDDISNNIDFIEKSNCICNSYYFENYFSKSEYTEEYIRIKEYFNYRDINYEYVKNFFDEDKLFFEYFYIHGLNTFLKEIAPIKNNKNLLIFQLSTYIYFLEKIVNGALNDYNVIDNEEYSDYIDIFKIIIKSKNFNYLNLLDHNDFISNEFSTFISCYNSITYQINNTIYDDDNAKIIDESKKIIDNSKRDIDNCKLLLKNKYINQQTIKDMKIILENLYKNAKKYIDEYKNRNKK